MTILHNKPKAEVQPEHQLTDPTEEEHMTLACKMMLVTFGAQ
jgi:hypothetical protein